MSQLQLGGVKEKGYNDFLSEREEIDLIFQEAQEIFDEHQRRKVFGDPTDKTLPFIKADLEIHVVEGQIAKDTEFEVRFGTFNTRNTRFIPGVPKLYFYNLLQKLQSKMSIKPQKTTTYILKNGIRINETVENGKTITTFDKKTTTMTEDYKEWGVRLSTATETQITNQEIKQIETSEAKNEAVVRPKTRWSFPLPGRHIDLTIVDNNSTPTFEVEIEYTKKIDEKTITQDILSTWQHMQKASIENFVNNEDTNVAIFNFNSLLSAKSYEVFDKLENKPKSFSWGNVFYGGQYFLTPKLDGVRKRLFFDSNGIFEVSPDSRFIRQIGQPSSITKTIIDTEFYNGKYFPFDALVVDGNLLTNKRFAYRLEQLKTVKSSLLDTSKPFYSDDFYTSVAKATRWIQDHTDLKFDGLIAQSNEPVYAGAATMKIKPLDELTVDLTTKIDEKGQVRLYSQGKNGLQEVNLGKPGEEPSMKTELGRYTVKNLKLPSLRSKTLPKELPSTVFIAEYRFIEKEPYLKFKGFRDDKYAPNWHGVVKDVYRDFFIDPVSIDDLTDKTLAPWRKWASSAKRRVIADFVPEQGRVLDIGIGRGGTMLETARKASKVFGVDPDITNLEALEQRISGTEGEDRRLLNKITILKGKGQDTEKIMHFIGTPVDTVLSMFSISFFFRSEGDLDKFVATCTESCAPGGKLLIMFMDGERVRAELAKGSGVYENSLVKITSKADVSKKGVVGVPIRIEYLNEKNPIFKVQNEWLAPFDVLQQKLKDSGFSRLGSGEGFLDNKAVLPELNLAYAKFNRLVAFEKVAHREGPRLKEDFQIKILGVGEEDKIGEKWIRHGVVWDNSSFLRSYLYTSQDAYKKGDVDKTNDMVVSLRASLVKICTAKNFSLLKDGNVQNRIAFNLYGTDGKAENKGANGVGVGKLTGSIDTKAKAIKAAYKNYSDRLKAGPVGHEAAGLLTLLYPQRKIVIINEDEQEIDRVGDGPKTSYILKVGNYGYSPLSKAEGYKHVATVVEKSDTDKKKDMIARFKKAVETGDNVTVDELYGEGVDLSVDGDYAIKTAVVKKNYPLVKMLSFLVDLDRRIVVVDPKGKESKRTLRDDLARLAGSDKEVMGIIGVEGGAGKSAGVGKSAKGKSVTEKTSGASRKPTVKKEEPIQFYDSSEEGFVDEEDQFEEMDE
uniref:mRNA (guanine-N(7))-methyltransferase n=1 Tax=viral metagenome TaxID=1070528 RepID=A0A6C0JW08_9ZZZZ